MHRFKRRVSIGIGVAVATVFSVSAAVAEDIVEGDPVPIPEPTPGLGWEFDDVPQDHRFADAIAWLAQERVVEGTSETTFEPNAPMARSQMAIMLWRYLGTPEPMAAPGFSDVDEGAWNAEAVAYLHESDIVAGVTADRFDGDRPITREQMASFLWRLEDQPHVDRPGTGFDDVDAHGSHAEAVGWLVDRGITQGTGPGSFDPRDSVTRGQAAAFLWRLEGETEPHPPLPVPDPIEEPEEDTRDPNPALPDDPPVALPGASVYMTFVSRYDSNVRTWILNHDWTESRQQICDSFRDAIVAAGFSIVERDCNREDSLLGVTGVSVRAVNDRGWELSAFGPMVTGSVDHGASMSLTVPDDR